jgi:hypothetical protein
MEPREEKTTDLDRDRRRFTWGKVVDVHEIGPYAFIEAIWKVKGPSNGKTGFFVYIDGKDMGTSAPTLDGALLLAIFKKHGQDGAAAGFVCDRLGIPRE